MKEEEEKQRSQGERERTDPEVVIGQTIAEQIRERKKSKASLSPGALERGRLKKAEKEKLRRDRGE